MKRVPFFDNPVLRGQLPTWRARLVLILLFGGFTVLAGRALFLQGLSTEFLQQQGERRYERTLTLAATRGKITDRNGAVLASSVPARAIWAIPEDAKQGHARADGCAGQAAGNAGGRPAPPPGRRRQELRLPEAPGLDGRGRQDQTVGHAGRAPAARDAPLLPRRRRDGPRGGFQQRRRSGPGRRRTDVQPAAVGPSRQPPRHQGPAGPRH